MDDQIDRFRQDEQDSIHHDMLTEHTTTITSFFPPVQVDLGYCTFADAASSTNQYRHPGSFGLTLDAGNPLSGRFRTLCNISTFPLPVATNATLAAWLMTGNVSVILFEGGL